jgi:mannitol/fructose-specific phosphotransferase system IIA component (Ntr-type)
VFPVLPGTPLDGALPPCPPVRINPTANSAIQQLLQTCDAGLVFLDLEAKTLEQALEKLVSKLVAKDALEETSATAVLEKILERERSVSTAIGSTLAVPHAYHESIAKPMIAIARLKHGINAGAPDGAPTRFIFLLLGPPGATAEHLDALANVARLMSDDEFRFLALQARDAAGMKFAIETCFGGEAATARHESVGEGLQYTGKLFGGIVADVKRRAVHYAADLKDGLNAKALGSTLFLFFACLAPAIIFGGLMDGQTGGNIGAVEMIVASALCGVVYAIFAGQPLIILGGTGPMLIFTGILYDYCAEHELAFLHAYTWVGLWTALILIILAATEASCLMRYFTRFTDEIFAALISVIFIYEAVDKLLLIFERAAAGDSIGYDVALLSLLLALGTYYVAASLSKIRKSHLLVPVAREFLADFGPTLAIIAMSVIAYLSRHTIPLDPLPAPDQFQTSSGRPWMVAFLDAPGSLIALSFIPALLAAVLVFLDQNITARLVNSPDNRLQRGESYHLDLGVVGVLIGICSIFGLPWLVAATVRSLNHLRSLATTEERVDSGGTATTRILHVRENRVTGITIHLLLGGTLLFLPMLEKIPLAVLFGLFLYMGIVSMKGNQFFERLSLWATDPELYPRAHFVRRVPRRAMHGFTLIQAGSLGVLWFVKASAFGILFPLFIAVLVPLRFLLRKFFAEEHLEALDAEEGPEEESESWS